MRAEIEYIAAVVRVWEHGRHGDPYQWAATVRWHSPTEVEILGVTVAPTIGVVKATLAAFRDIGVDRVLFLRIKNGVSVLHGFDTERKNNASCQCESPTVDRG